MKKGTKVGCILYATDTQVHLLGYGKYQGEAVPPKDSLGLGGLLHSAGVPSPRIELDSGETVYGFECWWGTPKQLKPFLQEGKEIVEVSITDVRAKLRKEQLENQKSNGYS